MDQWRYFVCAPNPLTVPIPITAGNRFRVIHPDGCFHCPSFPRTPPGCCRHAPQYESSIRIGCCRRARNCQRNKQSRGQRERDASSSPSLRATLRVRHGCILQAHSAGQRPPATSALAYSMTSLQNESPVARYQTKGEKNRAEMVLGGRCPPHLFGTVCLEWSAPVAPRPVAVWKAPWISIRG